MRTQSTLIVTCCFLAFLLLAAAPQSSPTSTVGRFMLVDSHYEIIGSPIVHQRVFKIDTATGKTWMYLQSCDPDGKLLSEWLPCDEGAGEPPQGR
jgi:hypothetical protein